MTFREYTSFGGTPDNAGVSGGPYRNNKVLINGMIQLWIY
jgi:hypothetical protein